MESLMATNTTKQAAIRAMTDDQLKSLLPPKFAAFLTKYDFMFQSFRTMAEGNKDEGMRIVQEALTRITDVSVQLEILNELNVFQHAVEQMRVNQFMEESGLASMLRAVAGQPEPTPMTPEQEAEWDRFEKEGLTVTLTKAQLDVILDMEEDVCDAYKDKLAKLTLGNQRHQITEIVQRHESAHAIGTMLREELYKAYPTFKDEGATKPIIH
jgi:hypothetical protein